MVSLADVTIQVGLARVFKPGVNLSVTTGRVGLSGGRFAEQVMRGTNLYVDRVAGADLARLRRRADDIAAVVGIALAPGSLRG